MKTFQEFLEEGKNKRIKILTKQIEKSVSKDVKKQEKENPGQPTVANYGNPKLGSDEHMAAIRAMMNRDSAWRKQMKKRQSEET